MCNIVYIISIRTQYLARYWAWSRSTTVADLVTLYWSDLTLTPYSDLILKQYKYIAIQCVWSVLFTLTMQAGIPTNDVACVVGRLFTCLSLSVGFIVSLVEIQTFSTPRKAELSVKRPWYNAFIRVSDWRRHCHNIRQKFHWLFPVRLPAYLLLVPYVQQAQHTAD